MAVRTGSQMTTSRTVVTFLLHWIVRADGCGKQRLFSVAMRHALDDGTRGFEPDDLGKGERHERPVDAGRIGPVVLDAMSVGGGSAESHQQRVGSVLNVHDHCLS